MSREPDRDTRELKARKEPAQGRSEILVASVLEAAARVLEREGWEAFTVARVCEVAGVSPGSLYQYFPSKDAIAYALLRRHAEEVVGAVSQALTRHASSPVDQLVDHTVGAFVDAHRSHPRMHARLGAHVARRAGPGLEDDLLVSATDVLQAVMARRRDELGERDPEVVAFLLVHAIEGAVHAAARRQPELLERPAFVQGLQQMARALVGASS
jgi:AcrR family transcriptional regulator